MTYDNGQYLHGADALGVKFDGALGQAYNDTRLIRMAIDYGFSPFPEMGADVNGVAGPTWDDLSQDEQEAHPDLPDAAYEALEYLNECAVEPGYSFEWVDGDLLLTEYRQESHAEVTVECEARGHVENDDDRIEASGILGLNTVRVAFPNSEDGDDRGGPQAFDWLNSVTVDFHTDDEGQEDVNIYVSTGDPRGAMRVANLSRGSDGSILLRLPGQYASDITSHEHYAAPVGDSTVPAIWKVR